MDAPRAQAGCASLPGEHRGGLALEVHVRLPADVHRNPVDRAAGEAEGRNSRVVVRDGLAAVAEWERGNGRLSAEEMHAARRRVAAEMQKPRRRSE